MRTISNNLIGLVVVACLLAPPLARPAVTAPTEITREQATLLLDTLKDPEKRERFTATLDAYVKTLPPGGTGASPSATAGTTAAHVEPAALKKTPGTSLLNQAFVRVHAAGLRLGQDLRSVTDFPALSAWLGNRFKDPAEQSAFAQNSVRIVLIVLATIGAEALLNWLIGRRRDRARTSSIAETHVWHVLPLLQRLAVRFGAILGAALVGNAAILILADEPVGRTVAFGVVNTYVALRVTFAMLDEFIRSEAATSAAGTPAHPLPLTIRPLLTTFLIVVSLQLLSGDVANELGAPDFIQEALAKCIALVAHLLAIIIVLVSRPAVSLWIQRRSRKGTHWAAATDALAAIWPIVAMSAIAGSWLIWALDMPDAYRESIRLIVATLAVLLASRFVSNLVIASVDRRMTGFSSAPKGTFGSRLYGYRGSVRLILRALLVSVTLLVLTEAWGLDSVDWLGAGHSGHRLAEFVLQTLVLAIVGIFCWEGADLAFERKVNRLVDDASLARATRLRTLQPIIRLALLLVIGLLVIMTALNAVGINIGPLLAGASIVGVALGFGSQKLVQDFITGIFLLVEDAVDVGDWVTLAGVSGTVEHISIRTIRLRGGDGSVYLVPFSSVTSVNNSNRGLGNAAVTVNVDPAEDTDRVSALLTEIARELRTEPEFAAGMQSDLQLWGVDKVDGSMVTISGQIVCTDSGRWGVQREFNRRMKLRFEREGIQLAVPHQTLQIAPLAEANAERRLTRVPT